ncbi:sensor histidine kinase [Actinomadura kijaniata]|uniref:sensor histidine kinase n=1 Tax=Actinomadura kijaniata TaxID=46161 RepID=UPI0012F9FF34|nr:histidine kinase [Actinomadura kijaniata]
MESTSSPGGDRAPTRRERLVDAGAVVLVTAVVALMVRETREAGAVPPDARAYLLAFLMALPILAHRRRPVAALMLSSLMLFVYYASGYPGISPTIAQALPIYSAVVAGHLRWAVGVTLGFYTIGYVMVVVEKHLSPMLALAEFLSHIGLGVTVILLAEVVRSRRALAAETRERLRLAAEERDRESARRVAEDRVRIARELHDTLAHSMATITVQAGGALHVLGEADGDGRADERVRPALAAIRETSKDALRQLRATLGVLRSGADLGPAFGLDRLPALAEAVRAAGVPVEVTVTGRAAPVDPPVDHAAYRILQESLTNVLRHAGPDVRARVTVAHRKDGIALEIVDDGAGGTPGGGHGLTGMRERVAALGGTFEAGPRPEGGFAVRAVLPGGADGPEGAA